MTAEERLMSLLHEGSDNPTSQAELTSLMNLKDARGLREIIARLRRKGNLILSDSHGYYLPAGESSKGDVEIQRFVTTMTKRIATTTAVTKAARRYLKARQRVDDGQLSIFDLIDAADHEAQR